MSEPQKKVKLGEFEVDEDLLENYLEIYSQDQTQDVSFLAFQLANRLASIHRLMRESVGLKGYWTYPRDAFDTALQKRSSEELEKDSRYIDYMRVKRAELDKGKRNRESLR